MTDEEIIAAAAAHIAEDWHPHYYYRNINLIDFAREIMKLERERCAKICENAHMSTHDTAMSPQRQCAYAIRNSADERRK